MRLSNAISLVVLEKDELISQLERPVDMPGGLYIISYEMGGFTHTKRLFFN